MRHLPRALCSAALVMAATTACGGPATTPSSQPTSSPTATSQSRSAASLFPLTITRTGGIAGFRDVVVVAGDGLVSVTRKGQPSRRCRLTAEAVRLLTSAATQVPWSRGTPASTKPSFPDDLVILVQSPSGGPLRLEDPQTGRRAFHEVVNELLNNVSDVSGEPAAPGRCPSG